MDSSQVATALLTEHLQYTPLSLIDDIIDSVNNLVYQGVGSLETGLFATPPERLGFKTAPQDLPASNTESEFPEARQEIEEGLHKLETLLNSTVDKNFDKFEIYVLRNILSVPQDLIKWIRLSHYEGMQYPIPADAPTPESVELLRQKLHASRNVNKALQNERRRNEAMFAQLSQMTGPVAEGSQEPNLAFLSEVTLAHHFSDHSQQALTTSTTFALSQLPSLRAALKDLRSKLATLDREPLGVNTAKDERREDRREYIEQRTRSHLQRSGQTLEDDASMIDGGVGSGNIESLETLANSLDST